MRNIEMIERVLSEMPRPSLRDGAHRADLKRELLERARGIAQPLALEARPRVASRTYRWRPIAGPRWVAVAAFAAAAGVVLVSVGLVLLKLNASGLATASHGQSRLTATTAPSARVAASAIGATTTPATARAPGMAGRTLIEGRQVEGLRRKSLSQSVAEAQVIVVGTALDSAAAPPHVRGDLPENFIRFRVLRVLKGQFEQEFVTTRTPTNAAEFIGRDWVIMLSPEFLAGRHSYAGCYTIKLEPQIKAMVGQAGR